MNEVNWKYVVVVYIDEIYGKEVLVELRFCLVVVDKCLIMVISIFLDDVSLIVMDRILFKILLMKVIGVIYLGGLIVVDVLLKWVEGYSGVGKF